MNSTLTPEANLSAAELLIESWPSKRTEMLRVGFEAVGRRFGTSASLTIGGQEVCVDVEYKARGTYGGMQAVEFVGFTVTAWHPTSRTTSRAVALRPGGDLRDAVARALETARKACVHDRSTLLGTRGRCLRAYRCLDCGHEYEVDSSD